MQLKRKGCEKLKLRHAELAAEARTEHQGCKVCEGLMRPGCSGSLATSLLGELRIHCLGFHLKTKVALDTKDSLSILH